MLRACDEQLGFGESEKVLACITSKGLEVAGSWLLMAIGSGACHPLVITSSVL